MSSSKQSGGHIKLARKMFEGPGWVDGTRFDHRSAWTDLIQLAAWAPYTYGGVDALERGEFVASLRFLAQRWKWPVSTVSDTLIRWNESGRLAVVRSGHLGKVYLLVNYDSYQGGTIRAGHPVGPEGVSDPCPGRTNDKAVKAVRSKPTGSGAEYSAAFDAWWALYPAEYRGTKRTAWTQWVKRLGEGHTPEILTAGVERYVAHCRAMDRRLKNASTFLGPDLHFLEPWPLPQRGPGSVVAGDPEAMAIYADAITAECCGVDLHLGRARIQQAMNSQQIPTERGKRLWALLRDGKLPTALIAQRKEREAVEAITHVLHVPQAVSA